MGFYAAGFYKIIIFVFVALTVVLTLPRFSPVVFPRVPEPSPVFDCDDATLATYRYYQALGIESKPIVGNLDLDSEKYEESNHVWLLVNPGTRKSLTTGACHGSTVNTTRAIPSAWITFYTPSMRTGAGGDALAAAGR